MITYQENYTYDAGTNLLALRHSQGGKTQKRVQPVRARNNRQRLYTYDEAGNQLRTDTLDALHYGADGQLCSIEWQQGGYRLREDYTYLQPGVRARKITRTWNAAGVLIALETAAYVGQVEKRTSYRGANLSYDGDTCTGYTTHHRWTVTRIKDGHGQVGVLTKNEETGEETVTYNALNHLDSNELVVDEAGNVIRYASYLPYGETQEVLEASEDAKSELGYSGQEQDATGLYYYGYRYLQGRSGLWNRADPIRFESGQLNLYGMLEGNPVRGRDLWGLAPPKYSVKTGLVKPSSTLIVEMFGHFNRNIVIDPDTIKSWSNGDSKGSGIRKEDIDYDHGIWRPTEEEGNVRPEDVPIYQPVRLAIHQLHYTYLYLDSMLHGDDDKQKNINMKDVLVFGDKIKKASKAYKTEMRDFSITLDVKYIRARYFQKMKKVEKEAKAKENEILSKIMGPVPDNFKKDTAHVRGKELWNISWKKNMQSVNEILEKHWKVAQKELKVWAKRQKVVYSFMKTGSYDYQLTYIGSLAKGYKSPTKQFLHFFGEKFDVDATLRAPHLALYELIKSRKYSDRGSIVATHIPAIRKFTTNAWAKLKELPGIDKDDPLEVFIRTDDISSLTLIDRSIPDKYFALSQKVEQYQTIQDRVWNMRFLEDSTIRLNIFAKRFKNHLHNNNNAIVFPGYFENEKNKYKNRPKLTNLGGYVTLFLEMDKLSTHLSKPDEKFNIDKVKPFKQTLKEGYFIYDFDGFAAFSKKIVDNYHKEQQYKTKTHSLKMNLLML
ncbi:RHS repeat-associated core domain-containing protein [uncultured Microscilla sp.]|uniref:RHS repeat domain-containing protein n=1 Tax=uncultured Microscilla sp. TaxID=432653 RepID=UPI0026201E31|nr:RHS repeat-associated core domain-containing protein [uncultured Microscilla sp.]